MENGKTHRLSQTYRGTLQLNHQIMKKKQDQIPVIPPTQFKIGVILL